MFLFFILVKFFLSLDFVCYFKPQKTIGKTLFSDQSGIAIKESSNKFQSSLYNVESFLFGTITLNL